MKHIAWTLLLGMLALCVMSCYGTQTPDRAYMLNTWAQFSEAQQMRVTSANSTEDGITAVIELKSIDFTKISFTVRKNESGSQSYKATSFVVGENETYTVNFKHKEIGSEDISEYLLCAVVKYEDGTAANLKFVL